MNKKRSRDNDLHARINHADEKELDEIEAAIRARRVELAKPSIASKVAKDIETKGYSITLDDGVFPRTSAMFFLANVVMEGEHIKHFDADQNELINWLNVDLNETVKLTDDDLFARMVGTNKGKVYLSIHFTDQLPKAFTGLGASVDLNHGAPSTFVVEDGVVSRFDNDGEKSLWSGPVLLECFLKRDSVSAKSD